jgi:hypothetical protein
LLEDGKVGQKNVAKFLNYLITIKKVLVVTHRLLQYTACSTAGTEILIFLCR